MVLGLTVLHAGSFSILISVHKASFHFITNVDDELKISTPTPFLLFLINAKQYAYSL